MTDAQFQDHIDRFGDDVRMWPAVERFEAECLLTSSSAARASLAEARDIRLALSATSTVRAPLALRTSIFAAAFGSAEPAVASRLPKGKERLGGAPHS